MSELGLQEFQQYNVERKNKEQKDTLGYHLYTVQKLSKQQ